MIPFVKATVEGDKELIAKLGKLPGAAQAAAREETESCLRALVDRIKFQKLSGQVLKVRTDTLRQSIAGRMTGSGDTVSGEAYTAVPYGAIHEYGFSGTVSVREHTRMQTMAFGKPMTPRQVTVSAHSMKMNMPQRSFMRTALADHQADFVAAMTRAAAKAIKGL